MIRKPLPIYHRAIPALVFFVLSLPFTPLLAQTTPEFVDSAPADLAVACFGDVPEAMSLTATVTLAGNPNPQTIEVDARDSLGSDFAPCDGGTLFRIWEAFDANGDRAREEQMITFGPPPVSDGPSIPMTGLPAMSVTVDCRSVDDPLSPDSYSQWLSSRRIAVAGQATPGCAPIQEIEDDAPNTFAANGCPGVLDVTFTVTDLCGEMAMVTFTYTTIDTAAPVLIGVANDTLRLSCSDEIPDLPVVTVDDCSDIPPPTPVITTTQTSNGECSQYSYTIVRSYMVTDDCGNMTSVNQVIEVSDEEPPTFDLVTPVNISCTDNDLDTFLVRPPFNVSDNCTPVNELEITFSDEIVSLLDCRQNYNITRTWRVTDACGRSRVRNQIIRVRDGRGPTFDEPADITVSCEDLDNLDITGVPTRIRDNCDDNPNFDYTDTREAGSCAGEYVTVRRFRVFDECGNESFYSQRITLIDTTPPIFTVEPQDLIVSCNNERSQRTLFDQWVDDLAGASYSDGCSGDSTTVSVTVTATGSDTFPQLPPLRCSEADGTVRRQSIDIRLTDDCGNTTVRTVKYEQIDELSINLFNCPESQVIATDPGVCLARVGLPPPTIQDQCVSGLPQQLRRNDTVAITSAATTEAELGTIPVDPILLNFVIDRPRPLNAQTDGEIIIRLDNVDAEGAEEYFFIYGEDGTLLGTTERGNVQCDTVLTRVPLPFALFNRYAVDGIVRIRLEPNIPQGQSGSFAINNLCEDGSRVVAQISQIVYRLTEIVYEVSIDGQAPIRVDPIDTLFADLEVGTHQITYRATDCGGNTDDCTFSITVEDREAPVLVCPADIDVALGPDSCTVTLDVPLPVEVTDNCEPYQVTMSQSPAAGDDRLFRFNLDPNLGNYQAQPIAVSFSDIPSGLVENVDLEINFTGQFNNRRAILDVVLPDGQLLASSTSGASGCGRTNTINLSIPAASFLSRLDDAGNFRLTLRPRVVTVPPGQEGDGLIPCDPTAVTANGQTDGVSGAYVTATFRTLRPIFYTEGATVTPPTQTSEERPFPVVTFNRGTTNLIYSFTDPSGNEGTCSTQITIRDTIAPIALCQATTIFVDPSGLSPVTVDPSVIDAGSSDNCGIVSYDLSPNTYTCDQAGITDQVTLRVFDASGNTSFCTTMVSIATTPPDPVASTTVCGGDTLQLMANPPTTAQPGQTIYTYRWFGPNGNLISTQENPVLAGLDASNSGAYRLVIRGITGCEAEGVANITIGELPGAPDLTAPTAVCTDDAAALTVATQYIAGTVRFEWYRGRPGSGTPVGSSTTNAFMAPFANGASQGDFYVIAFVNGCESPVSNVVTVRTVQRPVVTIADTAITVCEFEDARIVASATENVTYEYTGPNGFAFTGRVVDFDSIRPADAGTYFLRGVRSGGCFSVTDSININVIPAEAPSGLTGGGPVCSSDTLVLRATVASAERYIFSGPNGQEIETTSPVLRVAPVTQAVVGDWTVRVQRDRCPSTPSPAVSVTLGTSATVSISTLPEAVCEGNDVILQARSSVTNSSYRWTGPNGFTSNSIAPVIEGVTMADEGDYVLRATTPGGCVTEETFTLDVAPGIRIDSIYVSGVSCLNGGETVAIIAELSENSAGNDFTYLWQGPQGTSTNDTFFVPNAGLASNGVYQLTVMNENGCSSPVFRRSLELDFAPAPPATPFTEDGQTMVCEDDQLSLLTNDYGSGTTYLWRLPDGTMIPTQTNRLNINNLADTLSGPYTVRAIRNGCSSLPSEARIITITPYPEIMALSSSPACTGQPIEFQATDIPGATYSWRGPNNFSSSLPDPVITNADAAVHAGRYSVVATLNGCPSDTMFVDVTVSQTPAVPVIQPIQSICLSDTSAVLELNINPNTATPNASYQWYISNGSVPVGNPTDSLTLRLNDLGLFEGGGMFNFTVRALGNGCVSPQSSAVSVRLDQATAQVADAGPDTVICAGIFLLDAAPAISGSGRWTLVQGTGDIDIVNPTNNTTAVSGMTEFGGPYAFAWTLNNGSCLGYSADTVMVQVTDGEAAVAGDNVLACIRDEVRLDADSVTMVGSGGRWSQSLAQEFLGVIIEEPGNPNTVINGLQADNVYSFIWTVTSSCGIKSDVVLVNVSDPSPSAGRDTTVCNDQRTSFLNADRPTLGSTGRWTSMDEAVIVVTPDSARTQVNNLLPGENRFIWEVDGGFCGPRSRDTVSVFYKPPPLPRDDDLDVSFQGEITFDPTVNDENPPGSVVRFPSPPERGTLTDNGDGTYTFTAPDNFVGEIAFDYEVSSEGCSVSFATVIAFTGQEVECVAPNIITPNNDGVNDNFVVTCLLDEARFPDSRLTVYNQWGDEVYKSGTPYRNDWDGTYQGNPLPVATYFYIIEFGGDRERESGDVRIER